MSELTRTVLAGTAQVKDAYSGLANLRAENRERKLRAAEGIGDNLAKLGKTIRDYGSWRDAKLAEDEATEISNAYALGMQTGEPAKALVTLGAVRPKFGKNALLRDKYMDEVTETERKRNQQKLDEADNVLAERKYKADLYHTEKQIEIERAKLALERSREARLGAAPKQTENIDPLTETGIAAAVEKARRVGEVEANLKAAHPADPKEPGALDQPYPPEVQAVMEEKAGLKAGALKGVTRRDVSDLLDMDPQRNMVRALNAAAKQREHDEHEPPKLIRARKELERLQKDLSDFRDKIATSPMADKKATGAREKQLSDAVKAQEGVVAEAEKGGAADPFLDSMPEAARADFLKLPPAEQAKVRAAMGGK